jgi:hypothetical protein
MADQPQASPAFLESFRAIRETANRVLGNISTHQHEWKVIDTWSQRSQSNHPRITPTIPQTIVLIICTICHLPETTALDGVWTTDQVRGISDDPPSEPEAQ